jgi:hypothetical protein
MMHSLQLLLFLAYCLLLAFITTTATDDSLFLFRSLFINFSVSLLLGDCVSTSKKNNSLSNNNNLLLYVFMSASWSQKERELTRDY